MDRYVCHLDSPVGPLTLLADDQGRLTRLDTHRRRHGAASLEGLVEDRAVFDEAGTQLGEYFAGERRVFEIPLAAAGSPFQELVWGQLQRIPYGGTVTYGEVARAIGRPGAARAVGHANARNPIGIVVPCHRVIGSGGGLTGYAGGLETKEFLLALESTVAQSA